MNKENNMINDEARNIQYDNMFNKPEAISRAPICNGISKFEKVPDNPPVKRKNTMIVP
ncbi:hypothetical protein D3C85_1502590 [compost metagenome]